MFVFKFGTLHFGGRICPHFWDSFSKKGMLVHNKGSHFDKNKYYSKIPKITTCFGKSLGHLAKHISLRIRLTKLVLNTLYIGKYI
jgi:hypothetical protein